MILPMEMQNLIKNTGDVMSGLVAVTTALEWAPVVLALPAAVYTCLRIYEWIENRRKK